jgi:hypothetical protein
MERRKSEKKDGYSKEESNSNKEEPGKDESSEASS